MYELINLVDDFVDIAQVEDVPSSTGFCI